MGSRRLLRLGFAHRPHIEIVVGSILHRIPCKAYRISGNRIVVRRGHRRKVAHRGGRYGQEKDDGTVATVLSLPLGTDNQRLRGTDIQQGISIQVWQIACTDREILAGGSSMMNRKMKRRNGIAAIGKRESLLVVATVRIHLVIPSITIASRGRKLTIDGGAVQHRHTVEVRLVASQINGVAFDTCRAVQVKAVGHCRITTTVDTDRTVLQVPIDIGSCVRCASRQRRVDE